MQTLLRSRRLVSRALGHVPISWAESARQAYARSPRGSVGHRVLSAVARVGHHRTLAPLVDFTLPDDPSVRFVAADSRMTRLLYWYGGRGYEGAETDWWRRLCASATRIVEVGANIGYYTVQGALAAPHADYVAVEANPDAAAILRRNVALNGLRNVEVIEAAVVGGAGGDTVELALPDMDLLAAPTGAYLLETASDGLARSRPATRTVRVPARQMRDVLGSADVLKLDIEGAEFEVLSSVKDILLERRPVILVEVLPRVLGLRELVSELHGEGFVVYSVNDWGLQLVPSDVLDDHSRLLGRRGAWDVLLVPSEQAARL